MRSLRIVCVLSLLGAWAGTSAAQDVSASATPTPTAPDAMSIDVGVFFGGFVASSSHEFYDPNVMWTKIGTQVDIGMRAAFYPVRYAGIEAEAMILPAVGSTGRLLGFRGHVIGQYPLKVTPFVVAGVGLMGMRSSDSLLGNDADTVLYVGGGARYQLRKRISVRADARLIGGPKARTTGGVATHFEFLVGASFRFGGTKPAALPPPDPDPDRDGFLAAKDSCPTEKGVAPDGCPVRDKDGDGILDDNDQCPSRPETKNGVDDADGCPETDEDGDTLVGSADKCPTEPEDKDGFEDSDGCPDPDNDKDGVLDAKDKCPLVAETKNGFKDDDGCADSVPVALAKFTGKIEGIKFRQRKATIRRSSFQVLDAAAKVLLEFPSIRVEIQGHTDHLGKAAYNLDLSQRRAQAVKTYLESKGIAPSRLEAKGYGETTPIANNRRVKGRRMNRRVEFKLLTR